MRQIAPRLFWILVGTLLSTRVLSAAEGLVWPTPNPAFQMGAPIEAFVQPTVSGEVRSGLFGCVRNGGARFHEGLDLFPIERDRRGEAIDAIYAILPGRVVHVSATAGHSSYGRYVVVVHDGASPAFHTLYAHLADIAEGVVPGARVEAGSVLGRMGRSAAGYTIPKERAHLHFEMGFMLTESFQRYFDAQGFGSKNRHGNWNGMNLVSVDPLAFYEGMRSGDFSDFAGYLKSIPTLGRLRFVSAEVPDFVKRYPALSTFPVELWGDRRLVAWDIDFTAFGVPKTWRPRFADEGLDLRGRKVRVLSVDEAQISSSACRSPIELHRGSPRISDAGETVLAKLFGGR